MTIFIKNKDKTELNYQKLKKKETKIDFSYNLEHKFRIIQKFVSI